MSIKVEKTDKTNEVKFNNYIYLGTEYTDERITKELMDVYADDSRVEVVTPDNIFETAANLIADGAIIGFYQGRSEYGARALGNRSILAAPNSTEIRDRMNILKGRELFRPLAPAVLTEHWDEYFEGRRSVLDTMMLRVADVKKERQKEVSGITHVDGSARVQEVKQEINPVFYNMIQEYYKISGIPMVINTSFNKAGEPIVESPQNAVESFLSMNLDALVCGKHLVKVRK